MEMKQSNVGVLRALRAAAAGAVAVVTTAVVTGPASAADVCLTQSAKDSLATCPGGKLATNSGKKPQVSFKSAPQAVKLKNKEDQLKPTNPTASMNAIR